MRPLARQSAGFHLAAVFVTICFWSAIATAQAFGKPLTAPGNPANIGQYEIELRRYEESGQYERDLVAVIGEAKRYLARQANMVVNVGDQASDLLGGYAELTFKLPNPFYVIP